MLDDLRGKGLASKWFQSYVAGRSQIVEIRQSIDGKEYTCQYTSRRMTREIPHDPHLVYDFFKSYQV